MNVGFKVRLEGRRCVLQARTGGRFMEYSDPDVIPAAQLGRLLGVIFPGPDQ